MKKILFLLMATFLFFSIIGCSNAEEKNPKPKNENNKTQIPNTEKEFTLATTTSTQDSGLLNELIPPFEKKYGVKVKVIAVGTGQAIQMGKDGDADVLLVHDRKSEDEFMTSESGDIAYSLMYNQFLLVGPASDPAKIKEFSDIQSIMKAIADSNSKFVSRGDDSGTHKKELKLWESSNLNPKGKDWYISAGQGMGDTLRMADEMQAYTLVDEATYLTNKEGIKLELLVQGQEELLNPYGIIRVKQTTKPTASKIFIDYVTGNEGQEIIGKFGKEKFGTPLFRVDVEKRQ